MAVFLSMVLYCWILLDMLVAWREPTPCYHDAYSVGTPKWAFWERGWQNHSKTTVSPLYRLFCLANGPFFFVRVGGLDASHWEGPAPWAWYKVFPPGQLSIEFVNVGVWLTHGDFAMDSCAQFLAVAEHRLIPSRSGSLCHQLRRAGYQSVWSPEVAGGHAGVGVVSLGGAPLSLPSFVAPEFREFF